MHIDQLLREVAQVQASDLYLAAGAVPCMSIEGAYFPVKAAGNQRTTPEEMNEYARQIMNEKQWRLFEEDMEANLAYMAEDCGRFRINAFWQRGSIALVCRRVVMKIPTLRSLGLPPILRDIALADRGIVLVTGSTGSGKSTTLASMIDYRNHIRTGHIATIEDPVEFVYRHRRSIVTQRELGIDTLSFHEALKNTLRQAPQVICIGEMRDAETVQFAMHAAETGHLVLATLHSTNSILALERILNFYPGHMKDQIIAQIAMNLKAIICQRLVSRVGGGRAAAVEVLVNTPRIFDLISKGQLSNIKESLAAENQEGIQNFDKALYWLCRRGSITHEDALQAAESANDLQLKFRGIGIAPGSSWENHADPWLGIRGDYEPPGSSVFVRVRDNAASGGYTNEHAKSRTPHGRSLHLAPDHPSGLQALPRKDQIKSVPGTPTPPPEHLAEQRRRQREAPPQADEKPAEPAAPQPPNTSGAEPSDTKRNYKIFYTPLPSDLEDDLDI